MKKMRHNLFLVCLLVLCTTICHAETITTTHVFDEMYEQDKLELSKDYTIATIDSKVYYTCSGGAYFFTDMYKTNGKISIFMDEPDVEIKTTQIDNLKEIDIYHYPWENLSSRIVVSVSTDGQNWEKLQVVNQQSAYVRATMPATGDYYVRIERDGRDFYIHQITYYTEKCACFPYIKPE